ncbi:hypothetical protein [Actinoplanes sp. NPDC051411]|uniref:hypothetical protein n=1 Tax=Actinoplanes sp. NPDC051411 TaxID=3155522 RepID=UPI0034345E33
MLLAVGVAGCQNDNKEEPTPAPTTSAAAPVSGTTAPDGGSVRVAEQGLSQITDGTGRPQVSFGIVLESSSKAWIATGTSVTIALTDASGKTIDDQIEHGKYQAHATQPQARTGLGGQIYVSAAGATKLRVNVGASTWYPKGYPDFAAITASKVRTERKGDSATYTFDLTSAYDRPVDGKYIDIIFRDEAGKLVGGAGVALTATCSSVPPGASSCTTGTKYPLPAGAADARTEVYVDGE